MAQNTMSPKEIEAFGKKFEAWTKTLTDNERTYFKYLLDKPKDLSDAQLDKVTGGAVNFQVSAFTFQNFAPQLDFNFFRQMAW